MDKRQQAQCEANAVSGGVGAGSDDAACSSGMYPAPPSYEQATAPGGPNAPSPKSMPMPMQTTTPMPMPVPMGFVPPPLAQPQQQQYQQTAYASVYTTTGNQATPMIHVQAQHNQQQPVIIVQQHGVAILPPLGPDPVYIACPFCQAQNTTRVVSEPNSRTHLSALLLCLLGFWCCACMPYCMDSCMSTTHYCKNCNKFLGTYNGSL